MASASRSCHHSSSQAPNARHQRTPRGWDFQLYNLGVHHKSPCYHKKIGGPLKIGQVANKCKWKSVMEVSGSSHFLGGQFLKWHSPRISVSGAESPYQARRVEAWHDTWNTFSAWWYTGISFHHLVCFRKMFSCRKWLYYNVFVNVHFYSIISIGPNWSHCSLRWEHHS